MLPLIRREAFSNTLLTSLSLTNLFRVFGVVTVPVPVPSFDTILLLLLENDVLCGSLLAPVAGGRGGVTAGKYLLDTGEVICPGF